MWTDLPKGVLYTLSLKTHFSLPFVNYINGSTAHVFNTSESWTACFYLGLFFKPVWCPWVLRWPWNGPIFSWQVDRQLWITTWLTDGFAHGFSSFVWHVNVKKALMEVIWLFLVKMHHLSTTSWLPAHPLPSHPPIGVLILLAMPVKISKIAGNSDSYPVYNKHIELPWIAIDCG